MNSQREIPEMLHVASGHGEPLVLAPGGLTGWLSWEPHAEALSAERRVIRVQLHAVALGLAGDALPPGYSIDFEAGALGETLDALDVEQADLAGWSYGGLVALTFALDQPDRVRSLTLIEPPAFRVLLGRGPSPRALREEQAFFQSLAADDVSEEQLAAFTRAVGLVPEHEDPRTSSQWPVWNEHRQALRAADRPYKHEIDLDQVRAFEKPVLLVKGEGSTASLHKIIDVLAEALPDARVVTYPGGHAPHIVSMEAFLEQFRLFLGQPEAIGR